MSNTTLQPLIYSLSSDEYESAIAAGPTLPEADQREILLAIGGRIGGQLVELYEISLEFGQSHKAAFESAIEEYNEFLAATI